jgi:hypothetical protein
MKERARLWCPVDVALLDFRSKAFLQRNYLGVPTFDEYDEVFRAPHGASYSVQGGFLSALILEA